jgi:hypothetical protein
MEQPFHIACTGKLASVTRMVVREWKSDGCCICDVHPCTIRSRGSASGSSTLMKLRRQKSRSAYVPFVLTHLTGPHHPCPQGRLLTQPFGSSSSGRKGIIRWTERTLDFRRDEVRSVKAWSLLQVCGGGPRHHCVPSPCKNSGRYVGDEAHASGFQYLFRP